MLFLFEKRCKGIEYFFIHQIVLVAYAPQLSQLALVLLHPRHLCSMCAVYAIPKRPKNHFLIVFFGIKFVHILKKVVLLRPF